MCVQGTYIMCLFRSYESPLLFRLQASISLNSLDYNIFYTAYNSLLVLTTALINAPYKQHHTYYNDNHYNCTILTVGW